MFLNDEKRTILFEEMAPYAIGLEEIRSRAKRRKARRRGFLSVTAFMVLLAGIGFAMESGNTDKLGTVQFTSFKTPGPPHLLNHEVSLGYLPAGFALVSDEQDNRVTAPADYQRTIVYEGGTQSAPQQVSLSIEQTQENGLPSKLPSSNSSEEYSFSVVDGHKALVVTAFDHVSGTVSYSYAGGQKHETITCEGPANAPRNQIDPICRSAFNSANSRDIGPSLPNVAAPSNIYPIVSLKWIVSPTVSFTLVGRGLSRATLDKIAGGISYNPSVGNCIVANRYLSSKGCAPGVKGSPPVDSPLVPAGGVELASGVAAGHSWALSADLQKGNVWVDLGYSGQFSSGGKWFGSTAAATTVDMTTADNGQSFLFGMVPDYVTEFQASVVGGATTKMGVLPAKLDGWAFFVLPLGKESAPVRLSLYAQNGIVYTGTWKSDSSFSGIPLK